MSWANEIRNTGANRLMFARLPEPPFDELYPTEQDWIEQLERIGAYNEYPQFDDIYITSEDVLH